MEHAVALRLCQTSEPIRSMRWYSLPEAMRTPIPAQVVMAMRSRVHWDIRLRHWVHRSIVF